MSINKGYEPKKFESKIAKKWKSKNSLVAMTLLKNLLLLFYSLRLTTSGKLANIGHA